MQMGSQVLAMGRDGPPAVGNTEVESICDCKGHWEIESCGQLSPERFSVWSGWRVSLGAFSLY